MTPDRHPLDSLLASRAVGALDRALEVVVDTHVALCTQCAERMAVLDEVGGQLLLRDTPELPIPEGLLDRVLSRVALEPEEPEVPHDDVLPTVLVERFGTLDELGWRWAAPGVERIDLLPQADRLPLRLLRMAPGTRIATHDHAGLERGVILAGGWTDHLGSSRRGDFTEYGPDQSGHEQTIDDDEPCIALILNDTSLQAHNPLFRWFARWVRL